MKKYGLWILIGVAVLIVAIVLIGNGKNNEKSGENKESEQQMQEEMQANGYGLGMYYYFRLKGLNEAWISNEINGKSAPYRIPTSHADEIRSICTPQAFEEFKAYWKIQERGDGYYEIQEKRTLPEEYSDQITLKEETENRVTLSIQVTEMATKEKKEYPFVLVKVDGNWLIDNYTVIDIQRE